MLTKKLVPGALATAQRWQKAVATKDVAHGVVRAPTAELDELALDTPVSPPWVFPCKSQDEHLAPGALWWPARRESSAHFRRTNSRCQRSTVSGVTRREARDRIRPSAGRRRRSAGRSKRADQPGVGGLGVSGGGPLLRSGAPPPGGSECGQAEEESDEFGEGGEDRGPDHRPGRVD